MKKVLQVVALSALIFSFSLPALAQDTIESRLFDAISAKKVADVQSLLNQGANIEAKDSLMHWTPLMKAADSGQADIVKLLLHRGANVGVRDDNGFTALDNACSGGGNKETVKLLLDKGANMENRNNDGLTPLMTAVYDNAEAAKVLLDKGARIDDRDSTGWTPLIWAASSISDEAGVKSVRLLLDKGAKIGDRSNDGETPLGQAAWAGKVATLQLLLDRGANIEDKDKIGETPLFDAAFHGSLDAVKLLLDRGAKFDIRDNAGETPLSCAASEGQTEVVKVLLDRGASMNGQNNKGQTALFEAAIAVKRPGLRYEPDPEKKEHAATAQLLMERGASPDVKDNEGHTPLEAAMALHYDPIVAAIETRLPRLLKLEQTQWKDPEEQFAATLSTYRDYPYIASLREKVIQLAVALPSLPAVPEDARKMAIAASQQVKTASTEAAFAAPIAMLRKALEIAPWWRDAYFNLSYALELSGQYDEAARQLKTYLDLKPSEADAARARARLLVIQMEKDAAPSK